MASDEHKALVNEIWSKINTKVTLSKTNSPALPECNVPTCCSCWNYNGSRSNGYGIISHKGKQYKTHRISFEYHHQRPIAPKLFVLHSCDNESCCNPAHLREGTAKDNTNDTKSRNRFSKIKPTKPIGVHERDEYRGFIIYVEDSFLLISSEKDKRIHKISRTKETPLPSGKFIINDSEIIISELVLTESKLFSACREYIYDSHRKKEFYYKKKEQANQQAELQKVGTV
jgi:hypothetical protein